MFVVIASETRGAWRELEARLRPFVARRVPAADVDDVVQEVLVRLHRGLLGLRDGERFGGWVYRIAEHAVADHLRSRARQPRLDGRDDQLELEAADSSDADSTLQAELAECVALFVSQLPPSYRAAITLTELEGLTQQDAADMLSLSLSGTKSRVQRGRERIRQMFEACCEVSVDARGHVVDCIPRRQRALDDTNCSTKGDAGRARSSSQVPL